MNNDNGGPQVELYTKFGCPYCHRAVGLLQKKNVAFAEYDITSDSEKRDEMRSRKPDARTVPQIFIGGEAIGGSDELMALESSGRLDTMLGR